MRAFIITLICIWHTISSVWGQPLSVQVVSREMGFGRSYISRLMEDHQGIIWVGTQLGLLRFDGLQTTVFLPEKGNPNSLSNEFIYDLFEDKDHNIWLATRNGLNCLDPSRKYFTRYQMDSEDTGTLPNNRIFSLLPDTDSTFFLICDRSGLSSFNTHTGRVSRLNPPLRSSMNPSRNGEVTVFQAFKALNGKIIVATAHGKFEYNQQENILMDIVDTTTKYHQIEWKRDFVCSDEGIIWFIDLNGSLYQWIPDQSLIKYQKKELSDALTPPQVRILDFDQTHMLLCTYKDFLLVHKESGEVRFLRFREDQSGLILPDQITDNLETQTGIVIMGASNGDLYMINPLLQQFQYQRIRGENLHRLSETHISDFFDDPVYQKRYISAIQDSFFYVQDLVNGELSSYRKQHFSNIANRWLLDQAGRLWLCNGSVLLEIDRVHHGVRTYEPGFEVQNLFEMVETEPGRMLVGSFQEGLYWFQPDGSLFQKIPWEKGWIPTQVFSLKYDAVHQMVWIGTVRNGLFRYDVVRDTFIQYQYHSHNPYSLGGDWVRDITLDSSGSVWFATDPIGISRFDYQAHPDSAFINLSIEDGLPSNFISGIGTDTRGQIWMTSLNGIARLNPTDFTIQTYGRADGLADTRSTRANLRIGTGGMILIGTGDGYVYFHPDSLVINEEPPQLVLVDILVLDQSRFAVGEQGQVLPLKLKHKENYITIAFSVINYTESHLNQVRYKMEGLDDHWNTETGIHQVHYTKVPPGEYTFRILAANNDGIWSEKETTVSLYISPPFWQRTWFYMLLGALVAGMIWIFYRYKLKQSIRVNTLRMEKETLRAENEKKLAQLEMTALRAQMNPHFIFNCLNSINRFIIINDNDAASEYLTKFSKLIRQVLDNSRGEKILLANEIETLELYIEMELLRFIDKFDYSIQIDPTLETKSFFIQPMLIQPYIENAIWHGLMHRREKGMLEISFHREDKTLIVEVKDNGVGRQRSREIKESQLVSRKSHGMKVTAERMALLSKKLNVPVEANVMDILNDQQEIAGTRVRLVLPLESPAITDIGQNNN